MSDKAMYDVMPKILKYLDASLSLRVVDFLLESNVCDR